MNEAEAIDFMDKYFYNIYTQNFKREEGNISFSFKDKDYKGSEVFLDKIFTVTTDFIITADKDQYIVFMEDKTKYLECMFVKMQKLYDFFDENQATINEDRYTILNLEQNRAKNF